MVTCVAVIYNADHTVGMTHYVMGNVPKKLSALWYPGHTWTSRVVPGKAVFFKSICNLHITNTKHYGSSSRFQSLSLFSFLPHTHAASHNIQTVCVFVCMRFLFRLPGCSLTLHMCVWPFNSELPPQEKGPALWCTFVHTQTHTLIHPLSVWI